VRRRGNNSLVAQKPFSGANGGLSRTEPVFGAIELNLSTFARQSNS